MPYPSSSGPGPRFLDWQKAWLRSGSAVEYDETIVSRDGRGEVIGRLSDVGRQRFRF